MGPHHVEQRVAIRCAVQPRHIVERLRRFGQFMRLPILDHLQPMLDRAEEDIGVDEARGDIRLDHPGLRQCGERAACVARPQRRIAPAVDQLMHLRKEFDFPNAAASPLEVETGAERLSLRIMIANAA